MIIWGALSGLTAFVQGFTSLIIVRFLLGFVEAYEYQVLHTCPFANTLISPFFPGALFLLSSWYTKRELALRTSILYSGSLLAGAFGGLIGASIENFVHNFLGIASWR